MSVSTNDLKRGMTLEFDGALFQVIEFQHVKPGKGGAFVRTKLRNLKTGAVIDRTFNAGVNVGLAIVERKEMQYLYRDGADFVFMDTASYEQHHVPSTVVGDAAGYLTEGASAIVGQRHRGRASRLGGPAGCADGPRREGRSGERGAQARHPRDRAGRPGSPVRRGG